VFGQAGSPTSNAQKINCRHISQFEPVLPLHPRFLDLERGY
jgi:hypothetical protein